MSRRTFIHRHRLARQLVTGQPIGAINRDEAFTRRIKARRPSAASPEPTPTQAALEASLLHVTWDAPGATFHPLGYRSVSGQRDYAGDWLLPHRDQLVLQSRAPDNWVQSLGLGRHQHSGHLDGGRCRLVLGWSSDQRAGWVVGPDETSIVFVRSAWATEKDVIRTSCRPLPRSFARMSDEAVLHTRPTDRLLSALVRRFLFTDAYLSPHKFFSVDGHLGLVLMSPTKDFAVYDEMSFDFPKVNLQALGFTTANELVEASFTDPFYGTADVHAEYSSSDNLLVVNDLRTGGRLLLAWQELWDTAGNLTNASTPLGWR